MRKTKVILTAPTSVLAKCFIRETENVLEFFTIGRRDSDFIYDFTEKEIPSIDIKGDLLIHMAAVLDGNEDRELLSMMDTNINGTLAACMIAKKCGIRRVILISSVSAILPEDSGYFNYYALSKRQSEDAAQMFCRKNDIDLCIVRPSQIIGEVMDGFKRHQEFFYYLFERAMNGQDICIYGKHDAIRNYIDIRDVVQALRYIVENKITGIVDLVNQRDYHLTELIEMMKHACRSDSKVWFDPNKPDIEDLVFEHKKTTLFDLNTFMEVHNMQETINYIYLSYRKEFC